MVHIESLVVQRLLQHLLKAPVHYQALCNLEKTVEEAKDAVTSNVRMSLYVPQLLSHTLQ